MQYVSDPNQVSCANSYHTCTMGFFWQIIYSALHDCDGLVIKLLNSFKISILDQSVVTDASNNLNNNYW